MADEAKSRAGQTQMEDGKRPIVAVTIGDPAGTGPEVVLGALKNRWIYEHVSPVVVGNVEVLRRCALAIGMDGIELVQVDGPEDATAVPGRIEVIDVEVPGLERLVPGEVQSVGGQAADAFIRKACELALAGRIHAICTAPISKESLRAAGIEGIGHTELLAKYLNSPDPLTLFITENLRIFFLSRHLSLRDAISYLTEDRLLAVIRRVDAAMKELSFDEPRIAVAGLNPHASDGGQFGDEEARIIAPTVSRAADEGTHVTGPIGADSVFHQALEGRFDCVIALYHDQGHIAAKTRDFYRTVTATLGLPVLRTSVDHGTAFDIAWKGEASSVSMEAAILAVPGLIRPDSR